MRQFISLVETFSSPFAQWRRWWGNTQTGQIITIDIGEHDEYAEENIEEFLPEPEINALYQQYGEWYHDNDAWLNALYAAGWQAILWDGSNSTLMMRFQPGNNQGKANVIAAKIARQVPVTTLYVDEEGDDEKSFELTGPNLTAFFKSGRLPT